MLKAGSLHVAAEAVVQAGFAGSVPRQLSRHLRQGHKGPKMSGEQMAAPTRWQASSPTRPLPASSFERIIRVLVFLALSLAAAMTCGTEGFGIRRRNPHNNATTLPQGGQGKHPPRQHHGCASWWRCEQKLYNLQ